MLHYYPCTCASWGQDEKKNKMSLWSFNSSLYGEGTMEG